jgi:hypothetical protein
VPIGVGTMADLRLAELTSDNIDAAVWLTCGLLRRSSWLPWLGPSLMRT